MKNTDFQGKPLVEFIKKMPKGTPVRPIFGATEDGSRALLKIIIGDTTLFIGDNQYDITPKKYATKSFKKEFGKRVLSFQKHNPKQAWLNDHTGNDVTNEWY